MRIVFMGTPAFAVPSLEAVVSGGHEVVCVVAQPDKPQGRGQQMRAPPVIERARELGLPTRQPKAVRSGPFFDWFTALDIDAAVVVAFGRILPKAILERPRLGCVNVHASLLPRYRGAAPIQWAVIDGEAETGCCTMRMEEGLDTGPIYLCDRTPIGPDETAGELFDRLAPLGALVLARTLALLPGLEAQPQDHARATQARPLTKEDGRLDWASSARSVHDRVRGTAPWPGGYTTFRGEVLKVHKTRVVDASGAPGTVLGGPVVACGTGAVELVEVQMPGRARTRGQDWCNGSRVQPGERLGA